MGKNVGDESAKLSRLEVLSLLLFAWCSLAEIVNIGFDKRRRTTGLLHTFTKYARGILLVNAAGLGRAYVSMALDAAAPTLEFPGRTWIFPSMSWASFGWSWFQALSTAGILVAMAIKISNVAYADHVEVARSRV